MAMFVRIFTALAALLLLTAATAKGGRVALVIGNGDYQAAGTLANPVNDAQDIAAKLRSLGFTVVDGYDLGKRDLEKKIGDFADSLDGADVGLFYYAGHGLEVDGRNFIVPVDAHLDAPTRLKLESIAVADISDVMRDQVGTSILILDACRNNPFARGLGGVAKTRGVAEAGGGLARTSGGAGSYVIYSADQNTFALDGTGRNSPFAASLLAHIGEPGVSIGDMMIPVREEVQQATRKAQLPTAFDQLVKRFEFVPGVAVASQQTGTAQPEPANKQVASAEDPEAALREDVRSLIVNRYLKPDMEHFDSSVRDMFTDPTISFGHEFKIGDLIAGKAAYFGKYSKWKLNMLPDSLKVSVLDETSVTATFDLRYKFIPKEAAYSPIAGLAHVTLDLVKQNGAWKIEMENSRVD